MVDLVDADETGCELKLQCRLVNISHPEGARPKESAYHVVPQRDDNELRILGSFFDVAGYYRDLRERSVH